MKAFRAIHIKQKFVKETFGDRWIEEKETVLIIEIIARENSFVQVVFVRSGLCDDGTMGVDSLQNFKDCEPNWEGK